MANIDFDALYAFLVVARELNMSRAAEILNITQPPLSRKIRRLETGLGRKLFARHSRGLELTNTGLELMEAIAPFMEQADRLADVLAAMGNAKDRILNLGLTTAFEQGLFAHFTKVLGGEREIRVCRKTSPALVRDVMKGYLQAALIALPTDTGALNRLESNYSENMRVALPASWSEAGARSLRLEQLSGKALFWFQRSANPAFYDYARVIFDSARFNPVYLLEPKEHEVLLSRIANGEGMALLPKSFALISRPGVKFLQLDGCEMRFSLGIVWKDENTQAIAEMAASFNFEVNV